jgi:hypothetical protein
LFAHDSPPSPHGRIRPVSLDVIMLQALHKPIEAFSIEPTPLIVHLRHASNSHCAVNTAEE